MLEARGLTKRYGGFLALDRVDFQVRRGEVLGYLGPNGSGKSTTVNTVVGLIDPSGGSLWIDGPPSRTIRSATNGGSDMFRKNRISTRISRRSNT